MPVRPKPGPAAQERPERLAINLWDLDRIEPTIRKTILGGKLDLSAPIRMDGAQRDRMDETGVAFSCSLLDAAAICDVIRDRDRRAGDHPTRVYVFKQTWQKLESAALLTVMVGDRVVLNPELFAGVRVELPQAKARAVAW